MTISHISSSSAAATSIAMPSHQQWDLLVIGVHRIASATLPTVPSGWTVIESIGAGSNGVILACKLAASGSETSGTWTNADHITASVYRSDTNLLSLNNALYSTGTAGSGGNIAYAGVSAPSPVTNKWLVALFAHRSNDTDIESTSGPTGITTVRTSVAGGATGETGVRDSNANYTSFASTNYALTAGTSSGYKTIVAELIETNVTIPSSGGGGPLVGPGRLIRN